MIRAVLIRHRHGGHPPVAVQAADAPRARLPVVDLDRRITEVAPITDSAEPTTLRWRRGRVYQPRYRRDCVGELVQIDGSEHRWFETRGPMCTLLVFIDDATSRLMHLHFVETESTFAYFAATKAYLEVHGKPVAFYSDKHSVFRVSKPGLEGDA